MQAFAHDVIVNMIVIPVDNNNNSRLALMLEGAGCGKTYTLDAIVHTLLIKGYQSQVCATTGKTLHKP